MYNKRIWLNNNNSPSTGSVVCFCGDILYKGEKVNQSFLQISDCDRAIRIHKIEGDTDQDFIDKLELLKNTISDFIEELKINKLNK